MALYSHVLVVVLLLVISTKSYLNTIYTSSDVDYLTGVITSSQDSSTGLFEKSLSTTRYATEALSISSVNIPSNDKLCSSLKSTKVSSWEEFHNLLLSRWRINNCLDSITENTLNKLTDGLSSNKLSRVYYSIDGISVLKNSGKDLYDSSNLDFLSIFNHIKTFQLKNNLFTETPKSSKSKPSIHKTSMALSAVAKLLSLPNLTETQKKALDSDEVQDLISSFMQSANILIGDYSTLNGGELISYSNSLTATFVVVESINDFVNSLKSQTKSSQIYDQFNSKFDDKDFVEKLVRYILTFRTTTSPTSSRHVLVLMNMIKTSPLFSNSRPISVLTANEIFYDEEPKKGEEEKAFSVSITNIFGEQILSANDNTAVQIVSAKETSIKKEGAIGDMMQRDSNTYLFQFGAQIRKLSFDDGSYGVYALKISVDDDNLSQSLTIQSEVKVMTTIAKTVFGIQYTKKSDEGYNKKEYPEQFKTEYEISPSQKVKLEIQVRSQKKPTQIIIEFVDSAGDSVLQITPKTRQEKYGITIDLNKAAFNRLSEGKYSVNLIVGDALYRESLIWSNIVTINCIEEEEEAETDYEPINDEIPKWKAQKEIFHTFGGAEAEPIFLFPMIFCGVVIFPLFYFIYYIFIAQGTSLIFDKDVRLSSTLFMSTLTGIVAILFLYWWQWNIFEAAAWLTIACIPASFFGYNVLRHHLNTRLNKGKKQK